MDIGDLAALVAAFVAIGAAFIALIAANYARRQATAAEGQVQAAFQQLTEMKAANLIAQQSQRAADDERHQRKAPTFEIRPGRTVPLGTEVIVKMTQGDDLSNVILRVNGPSLAGIARNLDSMPENVVDLGAFHVGAEKTAVVAYSVQVPRTSLAVYLTCTKADDDQCPPWNLPPIELPPPNQPRVRWIGG